MQKFSFKFSLELQISVNLLSKLFKLLNPWKEEPKLKFWPIKVFYFIMRPNLTHLKQKKTYKKKIKPNLDKK